MRLHSRHLALLSLELRVAQESLLKMPYAAVGVLV